MEFPTFKEFHASAIRGKPPICIMVECFPHEENAPEILLDPADVMNINSIDAKFFRVSILVEGLTEQTLKHFNDIVLDWKAQIVRNVLADMLEIDVQDGDVIILSKYKGVDKMKCFRAIYNQPIYPDASWHRLRIPNYDPKMHIWYMKIMERWHKQILNDLVID